MPRPKTGSAYKPKNAPDGPWWCRITLSCGFRPAGWPIPGSEKWSPAKAKEYAAAKQEQALRDKLVRPSASASARPTTIASIVERWAAIVAASDLKKSTKRQHKSSGNVIADKLGARTPDELTVPVLRAWLREERAGRSASRIRNVFFSLSKMIDDATGEGWWTGANPCRSKLVLAELPSPRRAADDEKARHAEGEASKLLASTALPRERFMRYLVAFTTGMIDGELAGLRWSSLVTHHDVEVLRVSTSVDYSGERDDPKTEARKATVPVHPLTSIALAWWKREGWRAYVGRDPKPSDPILPGPTGAPWRDYQMAEIFRADLEAAGLPSEWLVERTDQRVPFQFRSTRRSFVTFLGSHGVDGATKDRLLRHEGDSVREHHYEAEEAPALRRLAAAVATIELEAPAWLRLAATEAPDYDSPRSSERFGSVREASDTAGNPAKNTSALVAQWTEQRFPKPKVVRSTRAGGAPSRRPADVTRQGDAVCAIRRAAGTLRVAIATRAQWCGGPPASGCRHAMVILA